MSDTITVRVHKIAGFKAGQEIPVTIDQDGTPIEKFWRRRLRDALRDQCCEVVVAAAEAEETEAEAWEEEPKS